jgi:hypothetical protein
MDPRSSVSLARLVMHCPSWFAWRWRIVRQQVHESQLPSHQAGRPFLATLQPDEDPEPSSLFRTASCYSRDSHRSPRESHFEKPQFIAHAFCLAKPLRVADSRSVFNPCNARVFSVQCTTSERPDAKTKPDMSLIYPVDPKQLPKELAGVEWPPKG